MVKLTFPVVECTDWIFQACNDVSKAKHWYGLVYVPHESSMLTLRTESRHQLLQSMSLRQQESAILRDLCHRLPFCRTKGKMAQEKKVE
jgi:hypothetical protein